MIATRRTLALIALLSGVATALVIHFGQARSAAATDALVAVRHPQTVTAAQQGETIVALAPRTSTEVLTAPGPESTSALPSSQTSPTTTPAATTATAPTATTLARATDVGLPAVRHVFLISLSAAGPRVLSSPAAPYLRALSRRGTRLIGYGSLGHGELADELALLGGQTPNRETTAGCPRYDLFPSAAAPDAAGLVRGAGCVYPDTALSLADQVTNAGHQWGAYITGMGRTPCSTPQAGGAEDTALPGAASDYDILHNPFIFFASLTGSGACYLAEADTTGLAGVLGGRASAVPTFSFIAPDACADGARPDVRATAASVPATGTSATSTATTSSTPGATSTAPSSAPAASTAASTPAATSTAASATASSPIPSRDDICPVGSASGLPAQDAFLATTVPEILASRAYHQGGVLIIAFAGVTPAHGQRPYATGALVLSRWTRRGKRIIQRYAPDSLLHSIEDMLDLQPLAGAARAPAFARAVL